MNQDIAPKDKDWNKFWDKEDIKGGVSISWSKKRIIKTINPYVDKNKKVLDAGCGSGFFSKYFCDQGMITTSLDYSDKALEMTQKITKGISRIIKFDLLVDDLTEKISDRFSLIFSDGLLEHFSGKEQDKILKNLKKLLTDDGVLINFVPNRFSPWELIRPILMPGINETPFILSTLVSVHKRNGLEVIETGGINTFPFAVSPDRLLGRFFGMLLYVITKRNI